VATDVLRLGLVVAVDRLRGRGAGPTALGIRVAVVVLGVAGFAMYVSPTGVEATRFLMD
jgi:hypothetical protein